MSNQPTAIRKTFAPGSVWRFVAGLSFVIGLSLSGCSMIEPAQETLVPPPTPGAASYKVILAGNTGDPEIYTGYLDKPLTVQQALDASGATSKFKGMLVDLARKIPKSGEVLKLPVTFDSDTGRVLEEQNYAVHAGDEILVRANNPGALDAMFRSIQGGATRR